MEVKDYSALIGRPKPLKEGAVPKRERSTEIEEIKNRSALIIRLPLPGWKGERG